MSRSNMREPSYVALGHAPRGRIVGDFSPIYATGRRRKERDRGPSTSVASSSEISMRGIIDPRSSIEPQPDRGAPSRGTKVRWRYSAHASDSDRGQRALATNPHGTAELPGGGRLCHGYTSDGRGSLLEANDGPKRHARRRSTVRGKSRV